MKLAGIVETALYTDNLLAMRDFYENTLGLKCILYTENQHVFFKIERSVLLIFNRAYTVDQTAQVNGSIIPPHATTGQGHLAFEAPAGEYLDRKHELIEKGIQIESEVSWPSGVKSFYFRDCDLNSIEITEYNFWQVRMDDDG